MAIVTSGLIYHMNAGLAKSGTAPGNNVDPTGSWYELVEGANEGTLNSFTYTTSDGWAGTGTNADPFCLVNPSTHYVDLASDSSLNPGGTFTVELWYYAGSAPSVTHYILGNHVSNTGISCYLMSTGSHQWRCGTGTAYVYPGGGSGTGYGAWKMVSLRRTSGGIYYAYLNGAQNGSSITDAFSGNTGASRLLGVSGQTGLIGKISALRIYNTDIGTAGITQNYAEGPTEGLQGNPPTVTTDTVTQITTSSAVSGGVITDEGTSSVTAYGVCWNTTGNPTTADSHTHEE